MDAARKKTLRRYNPELRTGIIVDNLLPDLHRDAGGFLTDVESLAVSSKRCNVGQVDELITILLTKENTDFDSFCHVLKKGDYRRWSEVLSRSAASAKRGVPGGAERVMPCPLIHSIKDDYLKVKDVFCGSPGMPSLDALKDHCEDLIHVAFSDGPQISYQESTIRKAETVRELARILFFNLSRWISFDFLDKVIEHFQPQLKDVKEQLTQYKEKLREILMEKLKEIGELQQKQEKEEEEETSGLELMEIVAKYRLDADGLKVQDLITERDFMAQRLGIPEYLLQVLSWRQGSVIIVFLLLRELQPLVEVALNRSDVCAGLSSHGVEAIYLNGCGSNLLDRSSGHQPLFDSLKTVVEESGGTTLLTPSMSPTQSRSFLGRLFKKRSTDSDVAGRPPLGGEVESRSMQMTEQLRSKMKELEEDYKQMSDSKQKVVEELMAKCTTEEERRMQAEDLLARSDEARRQAEEGRRRAEEGRRRAEEACRLAEDGRKKAEEDWRQSEEGKKKAEEGRRRAEEGWWRAEDNLHDAQLQKNQVETELEQYRLRDGVAAGEHHQFASMAEDEQAKLRKENEKLRATNACLDRENEAYAKGAIRMSDELKSLYAQVHQQQAQLDASRRTSSERRESAQTAERQHGGPRGNVRQKDSTPLRNSNEVIDSKAGSLELSCVLQCTSGEVQGHLRAFHKAMETSSLHAAYMSGSQHRDWRCLAVHVGLHEADLSATNCERRVRIICDEWSKKETVTVAKVHQVLTKAQCTRAAECLLSAAQSMAEQEEGDVFLDLEGHPDQLC